MGGAAFEAAVTPALAEYDKGEKDTHSYILCKRPDESVYHFIEMFKDQDAANFHGKSDAFKAMNKRLGAAKANDKSRKAAFMMGLPVCVSTPRKTVAHRLG